MRTILISHQDRKHVKITQRNKGLPRLGKYPLVIQRSELENHYFLEVKHLQMGHGFLSYVIYPPVN